MKSCQVNECENLAIAKMLCKFHYQRKRKGIELTARRRPHVSSEKPTCIVDTCSSKKQHSGHCKTHAKQRNIPPYDIQCSFEGCGNQRSSFEKGLCQSHLTHLRRSGVLKPLRNIQVEKHGKTMQEQGYVLVWSPEHPNARKNGRLFEHVFVMSNHLNRPLLPHENVHHKNGDRSDNRIENLELWSTKQPCGQRAEDKLRYALEIAELYYEDFKERVT